MVALERWTDVWGPVMLTIIWQAALLAFLVLACERALRIRAAQVRHRLWWVVLAAPLLLAPARLALERRSATVAMPAPAPVVAAVEFTQSLLRPASAPASLLPHGFHLSWPALLLAAWVLGCAFVGGRLLLGHRWLRRLLTASQPVSEGGARQVLQSLCRQAGLRQEVALRSTAALTAPLLYGLRRPTILMPREWLDALSLEDLRVVLAHEVAHIKRRDVLGNLLQRLAELPLFFHPAAWLAGRRIMLAREELCDAAALGETADPRSYALSLLSVAERTRGALALASVGVAEGKFTLLKRVEAIMARNNARRLSRMAGVVLGVLVLAVAAGATAVELRSNAGGGTQDTALTGAALAEGQQVLSNMKGVALAVHMFMADHDDVLPTTNDTAKLMKLLGPYVKDQSVFLRPGTKTPAMKFTFKPGKRYDSIEAPAKQPMAVADYHPDFRVVAYLDGHVESEPPVPSPSRGVVGGGSRGGGASGPTIRKEPSYEWLAEPTRSEAVQVLSNTKNVALAVLMFAADQDDVLPATNDTAKLMELLKPYVRQQSIFLRPSTKTPAMTFAFQPGKRYDSIGAPAKKLMAVVDYHPEWRVEAYLDGHVVLVPKGEAASPKSGSRN